MYRVLGDEARKGVGGALFCMYGYPPVDQKVQRRLLGVIQGFDPCAQ